MERWKGNLEPEKINVPKIKQVILTHSIRAIFLACDGAVYVMEYDGTLSATNLSNIQTMRYGHDFTILQSSDGNIWGYGNPNNYGRLDIEGCKNFSSVEKINGPQNIHSIYCYQTHSFVLRVDGTVWACGTSNNYGNLGITQEARNMARYPTINLQKIEIPSKIVSVHSFQYQSLFLGADGVVWTCGRSNAGEVTKTPTKLSSQLNIVSMVGCDNFALFNDENGAVYLRGQFYGDHSEHQMAKLSKLPKIQFSVVLKSVAKVVFQELQKGKPTEELVDKLKGTFGEAIPPTQIKDYFFSGTIPLCNWEGIQEPIHAQYLEATQLVNNNSFTLGKLSEELVKQRMIVKDLESKIATTEKSLKWQKTRQDILHYCGEFLKPVVSVEKELVKSFTEKFTNTRGFSVDDVCCYLNSVSLSDAIECIRQKNVTGEQLILLSEISEVSAWI